MIRWRVAVVAGLALVAGATLMAERRGAVTSQPGPAGRAARQSVSLGSSWTIPYDGKFVFVRMFYNVGFGGGGFGGRGRLPPWAHDYPEGEQHFMKILTTVTNVSAHVDETSVIDFGDPDMFKFPVIYLIEPGYWYPTDEQVVALRLYLAKGGFMIVDDFPSGAWSNFEAQMARVLPEGQWQDLDVTHPIFHTFFEVASLSMPTAYALGDHPIFRAMYEENDPKKRMQIMVNYQNDISEFWEFSQTGQYAIDETNEAYKVGVNEFMYGITH